MQSKIIEELWDQSVNFFIYEGYFGNFLCTRTFLLVIGFSLIITGFKFFETKRKFSNGHGYFCNFLYRVWTKKMKIVNILVQLCKLLWWDQICKVFYVIWSKNVKNLIFRVQVRKFLWWDQICKVNCAKRIFRVKIFGCKVKKKKFVQQGQFGLFWDQWRWFGQFFLSWTDFAKIFFYRVHYSIIFLRDLFCNVFSAIFGYQVLVLGIMIKLMVICMQGITVLSREMSIYFDRNICYWGILVYGAVKEALYSIEEVMRLDCSRIIIVVKGRGCCGPVLILASFLGSLVLISSNRMFTRGLFCSINMSCLHIFKFSKNNVLML